MTSADIPRQGPRVTGPGHLDSDTLALMALGEPTSAEDSAHVGSCDHCRAEVQSLRSVVDVGRTLRSDDLVAVTPPGGLWERIAAEAGVESPPAGGERAGLRALADEPRPTPRPLSTGNRRLTWLLAAAVVGAVVGTAGTVAWQSVRTGPRVVASARLQPLPSKQASGSAEVDDVDKGRELSVHVKTAPPQGAYLEVWLMSDPKHLISLGALQSSTGSFALPAGLDLSRYKIVDVSVEPYDGNPAHSTDSLVRGSLRPS
jgi:anti-sigma-K factor RskA